MKVFVVEDDESIYRIEKIGNSCKGCIYQTIQEDLTEEHAMDGHCILDKTSRLPCVDCIYVIKKDE